MLCPHCQAPNTEDARFCGACGRATSLTEPVSNPNLGEGPQLIGRVIAGRYRILAKLGEGGMGAVYQAEQISLKRTVAIKLLRPEVSGSAVLLRRFNAEAEAVAKLRHPNTVNIYDFGQDTDGTLFIAMELIEGRSLRTVIHREAPLAIRRTLAIASQVAASLADAHAKTIIHRDLKPDNVMLTDRGRSKDNVTVLDFGIAKLRDDSRGTQHQMTQAGDMLGTPQYMAPEQIRGEPIDGRTDVYALGGMIYEMITGRLPYEAPSVMALLSKHLLEQAPPPSQRRPELGIPPMIDDLVMSAMAKDPAARPPTMEDFGERIAAALAALPPEPTLQRSAVVSVPPGGAVPYAATPPAYSVDGSGFVPPMPPPPGSPTSSPGPGTAPSRVGPPTSPPPLHPASQPPGTYPPSQPPGTYPPSQPPGTYPPSYPPGSYPASQPPGSYPASQPPGSYPPPGYGAPYAGPPPGPPYPHGFAPSGGGSKLPWVIVAVLLLGAGGAGIYFATRDKSASTVASERETDPDKPDKPDPDQPDKPDQPDRPDWDKPDPDKPDPDDPPDDPEDSEDAEDHDVTSGSAGASGTSGTSGSARASGTSGASGTASVPGKTVDVGQGVKIIAPPGMAVQRRAGGVVIIGNPNRLAIITAPITEKSNDPDVLARAYATSNGLQLADSKSEQIAGAQRKVYGFGGMVNGVPVAHIGVPLIGPGYRVAVILHVPAQTLQSDPTLLATMEEILKRRIIVPAASR